VIAAWAGVRSLDASLVGQTAFLVSFPVLASIIGALIAVIRPPGPRIVSGIQHFAAGVVTAALVGEIMPELHKAGHLVWTVVGVVAGALLVLALGAYGRRTEQAAEVASEAEARRIEDVAMAGAYGSTTMGDLAAAAAPAGIRKKTIKRAAVALPIGMLAAMAVDLLLDGILIGVGVRLGATQGLILTVALTLEILFLGLSVVAEVTEAGASKTRAVVITIVLGLVTAVGAIGGAALLGGVSETVMAAVLAFGAAALLYLVVEELLVEAHEEKESVWLGAMFFLGFLVIYVLAAMGG